MAEKNEKGFLSALWKANQKIAKYGSLFTIGIWCFSSKAAVMAKRANPDADIFDVLGTHYSTMLETGFEYLPEGLSILFSESAALLTDTVVPFLGTAIRTAMSHDV